MAHKVVSGKKYRILTIQVAVPDDAPDAEVCDTFSALLSENGVDNIESVVADWTYYFKDAAPVIKAPKNVVEGEIFEEAKKYKPPSKAELADLPRLYRWQQESLEAFRKKFNARSNVEALDAIDKLQRAQAIRDQQTPEKTAAVLASLNKSIGLTEPSGVGKTSLLSLRDDPTLDGTDAAHPAWWRGEDHGIQVVCEKINKLLDGEGVRAYSATGSEIQLLYGKTLERVARITKTLDALATVAGYLKERAEHGC